MHRPFAAWLRDVDPNLALCAGYDSVQLVHTFEPTVGAGGVLLYEVVNLRDIHRQGDGCFDPRYSAGSYFKGYDASEPCKCRREGGSNKYLPTTQQLVQSCDTFYTTRNNNGCKSCGHSAVQLPITPRTTPNNSYSYGRRRLRQQRANLTTGHETTPTPDVVCKLRPTSL